MQMQNRARSRAGAGSGSPRRRRGLLDRGRDARDLALLEKHELVGNRLLDRGGYLRAELAHADAVLLGAEDGVDAGLQAAALRRLDGLEDGDVDTLERARHDLGAEVALVGVDADPEHL